MFVIWSITYHDDVNWMVAKLLNTLKTCFNCDRRPNTHSASNENSHKILLFYVFCVWYKYIERFACARVRVRVCMRVRKCSSFYFLLLCRTHIANSNSFSTFVCRLFDRTRVFVDCFTTATSVCCSLCCSSFRLLCVCGFPMCKYVPLFVFICIFNTIFMDAMLTCSIN